MPDKKVESISDTLENVKFDEPGAPPEPMRLSYSSIDELWSETEAWVKARKEWEAQSNDH
jgi:hypothetical protein